MNDSRYISGKVFLEQVCWGDTTQCSGIARAKAAPEPEARCQIRGTGLIHAPRPCTSTLTDPFHLQAQP
jgi:hypothetical protein